MRRISPGSIALASPSSLMKVCGAGRAVPSASVISTDVLYRTGRSGFSPLAALYRRTGARDGGAVVKHDLNDGLLGASANLSWVMAALEDLAEGAKDGGFSGSISTP